MMRVTSKRSRPRPISLADFLSSSTRGPPLSHSPPPIPLCSTPLCPPPLHVNQLPPFHPSSESSLLPGVFYRIPPNKPVKDEFEDLPTIEGYIPAVAMPGSKNGKAVNSKIMNSEIIEDEGLTFEIFEKKKKVNIAQLDGNADLPQDIPKCLGNLDCPDASLFHAITIFRGMDNIWSIKQQ